MAGKGEKRVVGKKIIFGMICFLLFNFHFVPLVYSQSRLNAVIMTDSPQTNLDGYWKSIEGDSPEFSNPAYDESGWQTVEAPIHIGGKADYSWHRKWFYIPPDKPLHDLGIRLGKTPFTDEVFINGHRIGSSGFGEKGELDSKKIRIYQIPNRVLNADGYNLLAVRVKPYYQDARVIYNERIKIGEYSWFINQLIRTESIALVFSGIFLLLGSIFLFFFFKRQRGKEILFFGAGTLIMAIYTFYESQWRYILGLVSVYDWRLYYAASFSVTAIFIRFTYTYLKGRNGKEGKIEEIFDYFSRGMIIYVGIMVFLLMVYNDSWFWYHFDDGVNTYVSIFSGSMAVLYLFYKFTVGVPDSKIIMFASVIAFTSGILEALAVKLQLAGNIVMWGLMIFVLLNTIALANRFFRLQDEVEQCSAGLEDLVEIRTQQLRSMEESRRRLLANISHDLRTPVSSVLGHAELLLEGIVESPQQQLTYIKRIHSKMLGFNRLLQDLFELAKIESQQEQFRMVKISAKKIVENTYEKYLYDVNNAGVEFKNNSTILSTIVVEVDEDRLDQVFANLISNAIRYTKQDGVLTIACELPDKGYREFDINNGSLQAGFIIADNGTGIAPEYVPHIFERFYRGGENGAATSENSGLGLAIAKEIIIAHGGQIWVDTTVKRGCTIRFILPATYVDSSRNSC